MWFYLFRISIHSIECRMIISTARQTCRIIPIIFLSFSSYFALISDKMEDEPSAWSSSILITVTIISILFFKTSSKFRYLVKE